MSEETNETKPPEGQEPPADIPQNMADIADVDVVGVLTVVGKPPTIIGAPVALKGILKCTVVPTPAPLAMAMIDEMMGLLMKEKANIEMQVQAANARGMGALKGRAMKLIK